MPGEAIEVRRGRRSVRLTSGERLLWPEAGISKADLFAYYREVAWAIVPHLRRRPFTMKRFRRGPAGGAFFQKEAPAGMPDWIATAAFETRQRGGATRSVNFPLVDDELALLWMVQMHCVDMNVWYSRVDRPQRPDFVVFDLDPPEGDFAAAARVALHLRDLLDELGLDGHAKTSGAGGMHVLVPVSRRYGYPETREMAERVAALLERRHPGLATTAWRVAKRRGVLVDARQNGPGRTLASVYSVRPVPGAPVSTPLRWHEVTPALDWRALGMDAARERLAREGDLYAPVLRGGQALGPALRRLRRDG